MSDLSMCYTRQGTGPPLVLLHGLGQDGGYFVHQIEYFSSRYTVYALDVRGHGRTLRGTAPFTVDQLAEDLLDFMDGQDIAQARILGSGGGGNVALAFALENPERVRRLVLNGVNLDLQGLKTGARLDLLARHRLASRLAGWDPRARRRADRLGLLVNQTPIALAALEELYVPVLVIVGTRGRIRDGHTVQIANALPYSRLEVIAGDRFIAAKNPEAFNRAVARFLE